MHCMSRNHFSPDHLPEFLRTERRRVVDAGDSWAVFSYSENDTPDFLNGGYYVDTNEMMHRAAVFSDLDGLWRTHHSHREEICRRLAGRYPERRHNDLELFERIVPDSDPPPGDGSMMSLSTITILRPLLSRASPHPSQVAGQRFAPAGPARRGVP